MKQKIKKIIIVMGIAFSMTTSSVGATSIGDIEQEREETRSKKEEAQKQLDDLKSQQADIVDFAEKVDAEILEYQNELDELQKKKEDTEELVESLKVQLEQAKAREEKQYKLVKSHIQNAYENGNYTYLDAIMSATDFSDIINKSEYIYQINEYDSNNLNELIETRRTIANKEALLDTSVDAIEELTSEYEDEQAGLQLLYDGKQIQIENYNESIDAQQKLIDELNRLEADQDARIAALEAAQLGDTGYSGSFVEYSGGPLAWPMPSGSRITSYFGRRNAPTAGASTFHRGVDIGCASGSNVISVADGIVIYTGYMSSAGNAVIIDHGGGLTTCYYHLTQSLVSVGQTVSQGQIIALSGNTGVSTGPHLHFAMRLNGIYVDPLTYY